MVQSAVKQRYVARVSRHFCLRKCDTTNIPSAGTTVTIEGCTYDENYNGIVRDKSTAGKETAVITVDGVVVDNTTIKTTGYAG